MSEQSQNISQKFNDAQNRVRLAIMNFIIDNKRPFSVTKDGYTALKGITLSSEQDFENIVEVLKEKDGIVTDEDQNVNFIYPVSAMPTNHRVTLADGRSFTAMCAIDAIGAAFTFHQDTEVHSKCTGCGTDVFVKVQDGKITDYSPKGLHALTFTLGEIANWAGSC